MYDRAPRALTVPISGTDSHLGPGYYDSQPRPKPPGKDGYAPFLSLASRGLENIPHKGEGDVPGPGHYEIEKAQKVIKGGQSPQYKEKRFRDVRADTPGPGTYTPGPGTYCQPPSMGPEVSSAGKKPSKVSAAQRLASAIKVFRKSEAPSIPSPGQAYGYEEAEDGSLIKHTPPPRDNTLGPAFYKTGKVITTKYKGVHFGNLTEKRHEFKAREGPGPGDYDVSRERAAYYENYIRREEQRKFESCIPRYPDMVVLQEEKKAVPGPGQYNIKSQFEKADRKAQSEVQHAPFLSFAERFGRVKSSTPAPGAYNETRCALESLKKASTSKNIPFGCTSVRFTQDYRIHKTPGPALYNVLNWSISAQSLKKTVSEKKKKGAFGTSVPRCLYLVKREAFTTPGPADYQAKDAAEEPCKRKKQLSVFVSAGERIPVIRSEVPPPGSYEVHKSFEKSQGKSEYMAPRTTAAKRKHASFLSGTSRPDIAKVETDIPGPGAYDADTYNPTPTTSLTLWVSRVQRFKDPKTETPGPGAYELSPLFRDTVLKRTYNATLNNPPAIQMDNAIDRRLMARKDFECVSNAIAVKK